MPRPGVRGFQLDEALPHLEQLEAALAASDTQLLIKGHLYDRLALPRRSASISLVANDEELGAILGDVDGVITDYSSVMFDAALIGLPVIFYPFDLDRYRRLSSGTFMLTTTTWSANASPGASTS
jgi:CDP-glycerol glycerophosphotransferase